MGYGTNKWRNPLNSLLQDDGSGALEVQDTDLLWATDGGGDIGASGALRPDNIYVKTAGTFGGAVTSGGVLQTTAGYLAATSGAGNVLINPYVGLSGALGSCCAIYPTTQTSVGLRGQKSTGAGVISTFALADLGASPNATNVLFGAYYDKGAASYILSMGVEGQGDVTVNGRDEGQRVQFKSLSELTTIAAAASTDTAIQIPADAICYAVSTRVTVQPTGTATYDVGVNGATTRFGNGISSAANTTDTGTDDGMTYYSAAAAVRITPNASPSDAAGRIRVTIHYIEITPPTS